MSATHTTPAVGDVVDVPTVGLVTVTHVGRRYFEGVAADGTPVGPTGNGLVNGEDFWK